MKKALGFLLLIGFLASCTGKFQRKISISAMEKQLAVSTNPKDSLLEPLLIAYTSYIRKYPDDDLTPVYLYKVGSIYVRMQNWKEATKHFEFIIDRYKDSQVYSEAIILAAAAYETVRGNNEERAAALYKLYLEKFPKGKAKERAEFYFKPEDVKMRARIAEYQDELFKDNSNKGLNRQTAHMLERQYFNYIKRFPKSEFTPNYCFEGGKLASTLGETPDAVEFWLTIIDNYPDYRLYPETMLLLAVEYENKMPIYIQNPPKKEKRTAKLQLKVERFDLMKTDWLKEAEKMYNAFLAKYPNHVLSEQARASLKYLGKSPNEVVSGYKNELDKLRGLENKNVQ